MLLLGAQLVAAAALLVAAAGAVQATIQCSSQDYDCAQCLVTNDTRPVWASPCLWLSGPVDGGHRCAPAKWWNPPYAAGKKYPTVHPCSSCGGAACQPPPPPPPCTAASRAECWSGTWTAAPKQVPSSKSVDGPLLGNGDIGVVLGVGQQGSNLTLTYYVSKNDFWFFQNDNVPGRPDGNASYVMGIGGVDLSFPAGSSLVSLGQNIQLGEISATVALPSGGGNISATSFVSIGGVLITNLHLSSSSRDNHAAELTAAVAVATWTFSSGRASGVAGATQGATVAWATRSTQAPTSRPVQAALATVVDTASVLSPSPPPLSNRAAAPPQLVTLTTPSPAATVITAVASSIDVGSIPKTKPYAISTATKTLAGGKAELARLRSSVRSFYGSYWNQSSISLPTQPDFERFWWQSLYVLAACNREGKLAPGLWGSWLTTDSPAWHGDCKS